MRWGGNQGVGPLGPFRLDYALGAGIRTPSNKVVDYSVVL